MKRRKLAAIVGSGGQDGRLLRALLESKGCEVVGITRGGTVDVSRPRQVQGFIARHKPSEVYYLAAFHHSSEDPPIDPLELFRRSDETHVSGLVNCLEAIRRSSRKTRLFYAASSHVFGSAAGGTQDESTPLDPDNVYGITKAAGMMACRYYRRRHGVFASVGILYNHESTLRDEKFVSRKIVQAARRIKEGRQKTLVLGDLSAEADWGYAPDYVEAMRLILALPKPDDFVVASGEKRSVREFVRLAFGKLGLDWRKHVREDRGVLTKRKAALLGSPRKLMRATGWKPSVDFEGLVDALLMS